MNNTNTVAIADAIGILNDILDGNEITDVRVRSAIIDLENLSSELATASVKVFDPEQDLNDHMKQCGACGETHNPMILPFRPAKKFQFDNDSGYKPTG